MKGGRAVLRQRGQEVAVGPRDLLEVQLKPCVSVGLRFIDQVGGKGGAPRGIRQNRMGDVRIDVLVDDQRNNRDTTGVCRIDYVASRVTGDAAVTIRVVPAQAP